MFIKKKEERKKSFNSLILQIFVEFVVSRRREQDGSDSKEIFVLEGTPNSVFWSSRSN
jgi:hypothetical protein